MDKHIDKQQAAKKSNAQALMKASSTNQGPIKVHNFDELYEMRVMTFGTSWLKRRAVAEMERNRT